MKKIFSLQTLLVAMISMSVSSCYDSEDSIPSNVPSLGEVAVAAEKTSAQLTYDQFSGYNGYKNACFRVSENEDMSDAAVVTAQMHTSSGLGNNHWYVGTATNLTPGKTYYATFCVGNYDYEGGGYVSGPVKKFITDLYDKTRIYLNLDGTAWERTYVGVLTDNDADGSTSVNRKQSNNNYTSFEVGNKSTWYFYQPFVNETFGYANVPVETANGPFVYGSAEVSPETPRVSFQLKPATCAVVLNITPQGEGSISGTVSGAYLYNIEGGSLPISTKGTCNLKTGVITPEKNQSASLYANSSASLSKGGSATFSSVIPASFAANQVGIRLYTTGVPTYASTETLTVSLPAATWEAGKTYTYPVYVKYTVTGVELTVGSVTVESWKTGSNGSFDIYVN